MSSMLSNFLETQQEADPSILQEPLIFPWRPSFFVSLCHHFLQESILHLLADLLPLFIHNILLMDSDLLDPS